MVQVWAIDMGGGAPGNSAEFVYAGLATPAGQAREAFPESVGDDAGHSFARLLGYGRCEAMGFGVFDVERLHSLSFRKTSKILPFYHWHEAAPLLVCERLVLCSRFILHRVTSMIGTSLYYLEGSGGAGLKVFWMQQEVATVMFGIHGQVAKVTEDRHPQPLSAPGNGKTARCLCVRFLRSQRRYHRRAGDSGYQRRVLVAVRIIPIRHEAYCRTLGDAGPGHRCSAQGCTQGNRRDRPSQEAPLVASVVLCGPLRVTVRACSVTCASAF